MRLQKNPALQKNILKTSHVHWYTVKKILGIMIQRAQMEFVRIANPDHAETTPTGTCTENCIQWNRTLVGSGRMIFNLLWSLGLIVVMASF
mgnify:CR=1 FL=1